MCLYSFFVAQKTGVRLESSAIFQKNGIEDKVVSRNEARVKKRETQPIFRLRVKEADSVIRFNSVKSYEGVPLCAFITEAAYMLKT